MATISNTQDSYVVETRTSTMELATEGTGVLTGPTVSKGEVVLEVILGNDALGASTTLTVGDGDDADRFITSQDSSTAGVARTSAISGMNYEFPADDTIDVKLGGAAGTGTVSVTALVKRTF